MKTKNTIGKILGATIAVASSVFIVKKLNNKFRKNNFEEMEYKKAFRSKIHNIKNDGDNLKHKMKDKGKDIKENLKTNLKNRGKLNITGEDVNDIYEEGKNKFQETLEETMEDSKDFYEDVKEESKDFYENTKEKTENKYE
ncbi:YtxH domain-containing protein [Clostridium botulinum]|nr:YtxH domain-containing protein [Clostridium botulinum]